jgi:ParB/RepB/Spo0J family partition protein
MMPKAADRAAQLKARMTQETQQRPAAAPPTDDRAARAHFVGTTVLEQLTNGRTVLAIPVGQIAPELHEELRQPRLLPLPEELRPNGEWDAAHRPLSDELLALGRSLRERQIQPIVVYPGLSEAYPTAQYLIAAGHRRWTAAVLIGMTTIDAIVIDPPTPEDLVDIQYTENEDRADFSDMERAWALARMKQVLRDAPWEIVEQRFRLSEGRRKQLMRLMAFTPPQQQIVARLRASETQLRPLHAAIREGSLTTDQADRILHQLIARSTQPGQAVEDTVNAADNAARPMLDGRTVGQLTTRVQRAAALAQPAPRPRWLDPLKASIAQTRKGLQRLPGRAAELDDALAIELQSELDQLLVAMASAIEVLKQRDA